jgi:polygalacturonase
VYNSNIVVQGVTILAPTRSPNTDDINPDLCSHSCIEYCYVVSGDDCVAIKSGWDEYSIGYGMPNEHIVVRRLTCMSPTSAVIALGSEMSGGIRDVRAEDITVVNSESGVRIKTVVGRGNYARGVFVHGGELEEECVADPRGSVGASLGEAGAEARVGKVGALQV